MQKKVKCGRFKTSVSPDNCATKCPHKATCGDYRAFIENPEPEEPEQEESVGDGQSHGADESRAREGQEQNTSVPRRVEAQPLQGGAKSQQTRIKHKMITFVETAAGTGLFRIEEVSFHDLVIKGFADRRVIAAVEATEF